MSDLECVTFYFFLRMTVYGSYGLEVQINIWMAPYSLMLCSVLDDPCVEGGFYFIIFLLGSTKYFLVYIVANIT